MKLLPKTLPSVIHVNHHTVWQPDLYTLPVTITFDATCNAETDELIPAFSFTKDAWGEDRADALTWYLSPHRSDFTFRKNMFDLMDGITRGQKNGQTWEDKPAVGETVKVSCHITSTAASYSVNDTEYASVDYAEGTVPMQGYVGFVVYQPDSIEIEHLTVQSKEVLHPLAPEEVAGLVFQMVGFMMILDNILKGNQSGSTDVTQAEAETLLQNALTVYRQTPSLNKLNPDQVHAAIDRVYNKVNTDMTRLYDEEISMAAITAASQTAFTIGSIFSFFPPVALIADGVTLATMATALGLQIDIQAEGPKIMAEANGMRGTIDATPELAAANVWNTARTAELTTLGRLKAAPPNFRTSSFLYAMILLIVRRYPKKTDAEILQTMKDTIADAAAIAMKYPNFGQTMAQIVATEDDKIVAAKIQEVIVASGQTAKTVGQVVQFVGLAATISYKGYKNVNFIKDRMAAIANAAEDPMPPLEGEEAEQVETTLVKNLTTAEKFMAGAGAIVGIAMTGIEIWQAVEASKEKKQALQALADNKNAITEYYDTLMSHQH